MLLTYFKKVVDITLSLSESKYKQAGSKFQLLIFSGSILLLLLFYSALISWIDTGSQFRTVSDSELVLGAYSSTVQQSTDSKFPTPVQSIYSLPIRLRIPKIDIEAKIIEMGLTRDGNMEAPTTLVDVGWYRYGPKPGEIGNAVLDGHVGVGEKAVFMDLHKLEIGDYIHVVDVNGTTSTFIVKKVQIYDYLERPNEVFFSNDGTAHLNLITCTGDWVKSIRGTQERLVVFSDLVE